MKGRPQVFRLTGRRLAIPLAAVFIWGCGSLAWAGTLQGLATYRERIALPPDAVFEAILEDVSRADAPAVVLGRAKLAPAGQPPFRFSIAYDDNAVVPRRTYMLRASVRQGDRLLFTTERGYPAMGGAVAPVALMLVAVRGGAAAAGADAQAGLPASYEGWVRDAAGAPARWRLNLLPDGRYELRAWRRGATAQPVDDIGRWRTEAGGELRLRGSFGDPIVLVRRTPLGALRLVDTAGGAGAELRRLPSFVSLEPRLSLTGMFTYMADAASISLCADGQRLPVALEADFRTLEDAYRQAAREPAEPVLVSVEGRIAPRPSAEESQPARRTLVVEHFIGAFPRETCGAPWADSPLRGVYWKLVRLAGAPVRAFDNQQEPHLVFATDATRISGSGGCNRLSGGFEIAGEGLRLDRMASTRMACLQGGGQEDRFLQLLENVRRYRIRGSHLDLLDGKNVVVARFEAAALR
jgi:copper homeostasis protein (lipoprotein)